MTEANSMSEMQQPSVKVDGQTTQGEVLPQTKLEIGSMVANPGLQRTPEGTPVQTAEPNVGAGFNPVEGKTPQPQTESNVSGQVTNPPVEGGIKE